MIFQVRPARPLGRGPGPAPAAAPLLADPPGRNPSRCNVQPRTCAPRSAARTFLPPAAGASMPAMSRLAPIGKGYRRVLLGGAVVCVAAALVGEFRLGSSLYLYTHLKNESGAFECSMTVGRPSRVAPA